MFSLFIIKHKTYGHAAYAQYHKASSRRQKLSLTTDRGRCTQRQRWQFSLLTNHNRILIKIYYNISGNTLDRTQIQKQQQHKRTKLEVIRFTCYFVFLDIYFTFWIRNSEPSS